ncbi:hypothetical protein ILUMI_22006 [Ignelater luminosus]|uniref:Uncharacterized protein n=1 Tax=Ignelater luminosus TaxID=2038154 RepID=A0A8K0CDJ4_IGNLU|nr:hypothetical protein ILUMI_22006 [Ignelater luminosus]
MEMCKYKSYLKDFGYPNIDILNDEQIVDIFGIENRYFLLKWLAKNLNSEFAIPSDLSETSAILFADFLYESGFCISSQKLLFVKGDKKLTLREEIIIFDRIFNFLKHMSEKENTKPKQIINSNEDLQLFLNMDMNLFSTLGLLKPHSLKERDYKSMLYKEEIGRINKNIENLGYRNENNSSDDFKSQIESNERQIERHIENFKDEVTKLKEITANIERNKTINESKSKFKFKSDFGNKLIDCNSKTTSVLQYFRNLNLMQHLNTKETQRQRFYEENQIYEILKQNADTSVDVLEMSKEF